MQPSFGPFVVFQEDDLGQPERSKLQQSSLERTKADTSVFVQSTEIRVGQLADVLYV